MLYGMGTVFVFLTILVFATQLMSTVVNKLNKTPGPVTSSSESSPLATPTHTALPSPQVLSAIKQAVAEHRQR